MVDRTGVKVTLQEKYSRNSTGVYGLVAEQVANLDENMALIGKASKTLPTGTQDQGGPPTSLSLSGKDRLLFFLASFSRDTTHFVSGTQLGDRQTFQVACSPGTAKLRSLCIACTITCGPCLPSFSICMREMLSSMTSRRGFQTFLLAKKYFSLRSTAFQKC